MPKPSSSSNAASSSHRDDKGRFLPGCPAGPGRPRRPARKTHVPSELVKQLLAIARDPESWKAATYPALAAQQDWSDYPDRARQQLEALDRIAVKAVELLEAAADALMLDLQPPDPPPLTPPEPDQ